MQPQLLLYFCDSTLIWFDCLGVLCFKWPKLCLCGKVSKQWYTLYVLIITIYGQFIVDLLSSSNLNIECIMRLIYFFTYTLDC